MFTQHLEQVGGPSANLSQLPLLADVAERREGALERVGGDQQSPSHQSQMSGAISFLLQ